jgi:hypothetical protein
MAILTSACDKAVNCEQTNLTSRIRGAVRFFYGVSR